MTATKKLLGVSDPTSNEVEAPRDDRVWLSIERKYRVAQYESLSISLGATVSLHLGETLRAAYDRVFRDTLAEFDDVAEVMREKEGV